MVGALVLANKRGRHPEFTPEDEELFGRPRAARPFARCATRASMRRKRRSPSSMRCSPSAARSPRRSISTGHADDRQRERRARPIRPLRDRDPRPRKAAPGRRVGHDQVRPQESRSPANSKSCCPGSSCPVRVVNVTLQADDVLIADRPETEEKFRSFFQETGLRVFLRGASCGRRGQARRSRVRVQGADRLRRRDARPAADSREPGDRRRPQRAALSAGAARRVLEASARKTAAPVGHPEKAPISPGESEPSSRRSSCSSRPVAFARGRPRAHSARPPGRR